MWSKKRIYINKTTRSDCDLDTLKFGEVFLLTDVWELNFKCHHCGTILKNYKKFLRHSIEHSYIPDDAEIENLYAMSLDANFEDDDIHNDEISNEGFDLEAERQPENFDVLQRSTQQNSSGFSLKQSEETKFALLPDQVLYKDIPLVNVIDPRRNSKPTLSESMFNNEVFPKEELIEVEAVGLSKSSKESQQSHEDHKKTLHSLNCTDCDKVFSSKDELDKHVATHKPFFCDVCHVRMKDRSNFDVHRKRHLGIKKFICDRCGKGFITKIELDVHMNSSHSDSRPFECAVCGVTFKIKRYMERHRRRHFDKSKKYACDKCSKRFHCKKELDSHQVCHNQFPAFTCKICDKKVSRKKALNEHMKLHSDEFRYQCSYCEKKFQQAAGLYSHVKNIHKNI